MIKDRIQVFVCGGTRYRLAPDEARQYDPAVRFEIGDTVQHKVFGLGLVLEVMETGIEVRFREAQRRLVHGRRV